MGIHSVVFLFSFMAMMAWWGEHVLVQANQPQNFNVINFGAVGNGVTDDSRAFAQAWTAACGATAGRVVLTIPQGKTFLLNPLTFKGPCKSASINVQIWGQIVAPDPSVFQAHPAPIWLHFLSISGLTLNGNGTIDGRGAAWWNRCENERCSFSRPTAMQIDRCEKLQLVGLKFLNAPSSHLRLHRSDGAFVSHLHITAPENTPNTDGIDLSSITGVHIDNCVIGTGDDCIAIENECFNINITQVTCGPGHGISIGSLGHGGDQAAVANINVLDSTFVGASTGARIKTWQGGSGYARDIRYENIALYNVGNPIVITQFYCPGATCANQTSAVQISNVTYRNVTGTTGTQAAVSILCSESIGCKDIQVDLLNITSAVKGQTTYAECLNAYGEARDSIPKVACLK